MRLGRRISEKAHRVFSETSASVYLLFICGWYTEAITENNSGQKGSAAMQYMCIASTNSRACRDG
jgi:predicted DNA-binding ArsR family transcriptional regulator